MRFVSPVAVGLTLGTLTRSAKAMRVCARAFRTVKRSAASPRLSRGAMRAE